MYTTCYFCNKFRSHISQLSKVTMTISSYNMWFMILTAKAKFLFFKEKFNFEK